MRARRIRIGASDFRTLQVIGRGAFGTVKLVQKIDNGKLYAMKQMRKSDMIKHDQVTTLRAMALVDSLHACMHDSWLTSRQSETC